MQDLPAVKDDNKNMKLALTMLNFKKENIFEFNDISYDKMKEFNEEFTLTLLALSKELKQMTGIGGKYLTQGLEWDRLKKYCMAKGQSTDRVVVSFLVHQQT